MSASANTVLCVPYSAILGDNAANRSRILKIAEAIAASAEQPDLIVLPELALSGYLLESLSGEVAVSTEELGELAADLAQSGVSPAAEWVIGVPLREGNFIFNAAAVLSGGQIRHIHRKLFLPTYGMFDEARYFDRGSEFVAYDGVLGRTAVLICEDAWHPELAHLASVAHAESVIVISASPARGIDEREEFSSTRNWRHRLGTYAEVYGQTYVYCNRSGVEDGVLYDGTCFAYDSDASLIAATPHSAAGKACLFAVRTGRRHRPGFAGDASRQGDARLIHDLLTGFLEKR